MSLRPNGSLSITRSWKTATNIHFATAFCFVWNLISWLPVMIFGTSSVTVNGEAYHSLEAAFTAHPVTAMVFLFPVIGLILMYHSMALWVNQTHLKIEGNELILKQGPMPWLPGTVRVPVKDIKQAYIQEYSPYSQNNVPVMRYRLVVQRFSMGDMVIDSGISPYSQAQALEQWLEKNLMIENVAVEGEVDSSAA